MYDHWKHDLPIKYVYSTIWNESSFKRFTHPEWNICTASHSGMTTGRFEKEFLFILLRGQDVKLKIVMNQTLFWKYILFTQRLEMK